MANVLGVYNPTFFAQEALVQLERSLGMANRVHRDFEDERNTTGRRQGEVISIRRPASFTAQAAPSSAQDAVTDSVSLSLDQWYEVKFSLTDRELAYTQDRIVQDHIRPAAVAIATKVDESLSQLALKLPYYYDWSSPAKASDIPEIRRIMFDNNVPLGNIEFMHAMLDGRVEADLLSTEGFAQYQGAGDSGVNAQMTGNIGPKYGLNLFANQTANFITHTAGSITNASDDAAVDGGGSAVTAGTVEIDIDSATGLSGDVHEGDVIEFDGYDQKYIVLEDATAAADAITVKVGVPGRGTGLLTDIADNTAVTFVQKSTASTGSAFHRNAFALAMAPLSELGNGRGAEISTVTDPRTGLTLRSRMFYDGDTSSMSVALDALWGVVTLDANLGVRLNNLV